MNKWKIAFWICLISLLFTFGFSIYSMIDQAFSLIYLSDSFSRTQSDLDDIQHIINETDLTQNEVLKVLKENSKVDSQKIDENRISLQTVTLIFQDSKLVKIQDTK